MFSKFVLFGSLLIGALASLGGPAGADNINTSGTICQNFNAAQALDIDYFATGVRNINPAPRPVICSVPYSPVGPGVSAQFWVDGFNSIGTSTPCTVYVTRFTGAVVGSIAFLALPGSWSRFVSFAPGLVSPSDYVSVLCTLPGNGGGLIYGITARQLPPR